jgi:putative transcriptional regulator
MTQRGHMLDDVWYLDYASGTLDSEAHNVLIGSHVELSGDARDRVAVLERIGGALMETANGTPRLAFTADDVLARAGDIPDEPLPEPANDVRDGVPVPRALGRYLDRTGTPVRWSFLGPGLRKAILWRGEAGTLWLLRARPGVSIPHHGHSGSELTLVLKGSFWDGDQQYLPGDLEEADPQVEHDIRIDEAGECVCLALTEGKLRFENPLLRAFQLFTGL